MSTLISEVKSKAVYFGNVKNTEKAQSTKIEDNFSAVFDKTQNPAENTKKESTVKKEDSETIQNHANIQKNKTSEQVKKKPESGKDIRSEKEVEGETLKAANEMAEKIAETFNVTVEEVESILETLGLSMLDLLNTENLKQVVLALNPECDALTLVTNEELFADLKGLMNAAQEFKNQIAQSFNLTEDDMNMILNSMKETAEVQVGAADVQMENAEVQVEAAVQEISQLVETVVYETKNQSVSAEGKSAAEAELQNQPTYDGTVVPKAEKTQDVQEHSTGAEENSGNTAGQQFQQNFVSQLADAVENANGTGSSYGVRGQDIINQITEHIRVHVKQDTTEMELQLHPASLGTVKVQITSAGGVLNAVFTTENEAVKTALESQLIQLKENFAQQGLKVESVEVNVSAQGFERSLDQQEQEQNRFENSRSRRGSRRIRLNGLETSEDILTEDMAADDRIVADMMIRNGNTVDYTV